MSQVPPECARLAAELRALQQRCSLSLAALSQETSFSKSSWHRYLNARALPPWHAVRALSRLADEPETRMRVLWELAEAAWSGRAAVGPKPSPTAELDAPARATLRGPSVVAPGETEGVGAAPDRGPVGPTGSGQERRRLRPGAALLTAAAVGGLAASLLAGGQSAAQRAPQASATGFHVGCHGRSCTGLDPGVALCGVEPDTLVHQTTPAGAGLEIRYNTSCDAAWARVWNTQLGDRLTLSEPGMPAQAVTVQDRSLLDAFVYTPLLAVTGPLTACLSTPTGRRTCYSTPRP
ncbi:helix-turn-helix domain-containing protein [Streptacidiphilus anmyonensis]|uniref:helix-turn-helix domain-containing protein n=1 Tax=Streptacidiphilus anmyonensis TaxID=405782 RepID=UPI0005AA9B93|nr:XRE family transcriptional regulator [Streptacidiphilus anmyonensis]